VTHIHYIHTQLHTTCPWKGGDREPRIAHVVLKFQTAGYEKVIEKGGHLTSFFFPLVVEGLGGLIRDAMAK